MSRLKTPRSDSLPLQPSRLPSSGKTNANGMESTYYNSRSRVIRLLQVSIIFILISRGISQSIKKSTTTTKNSNWNLTFECPNYCSCQHEPSIQDLKIYCQSNSSESTTKSNKTNEVRISTNPIRHLSIRNLKIDFWSSFQVLSNVLTSDLEELTLDEVIIDPTYLFNSYIFKDLENGLRTLKISKSRTVRDGHTDDPMRSEEFTMSYFTNLEQLDSLTLCDNSPTLSMFLLNSLPVVSHITIVNGSIAHPSLDSFAHLTELKSLNLSYNKIHSIPLGLGFYLPQLTSLDFSYNHIEHLQEQLFDGFSHLRYLNVSNNKIRYIDTEVFIPLSSLEIVDMSHNEMLQIFEPYFEYNKKLRVLRMSHTWSQASFSDGETAQRSLMEINRLIDTLQSVETLDLSYNHLTTIPESLSHLTNLQRLQLHGNLWKCTCDDRWVLPWLVPPNITIQDSNETHTIWCSNSNSNNQQHPFSSSYIQDHLNCTNSNIIAKIPIKFYALLGKSALLKCHPQRPDSPIITWITPRQRRISTVNGDQPDESYTHILENGSMYISNITTSDFGLYLCVASYQHVNITHYVHLGMDTSIFLDIKYVSIIVGWMSSVGFLLTVLLVQLVRYLLNRFGLDCPKPVSPHHAKRVKSFFESLEQHNNSQLDWLRDNYNMQARRIKDNCTFQLERIRESYTNQTKNLSEIRDYGTQQLHTIRDQYFDQIRRVSSYSTQHLCRVRENYLFQRNRVRKFSSHQLLKLRETYKWQAQTLNKILENLPNLNFDTCRGMGSCGRTDSIYLNDLDCEFLPSEAIQEKEHEQNEDGDDHCEQISLLIPAELVINNDNTELAVVIIDSESQGVSHNCKIEEKGDV